MDRRAERCEDRAARPYKDLASGAKTPTWVAFAVAAVLTIGTLLPRTAAAQASPDNWEFRTTLYGYVPSLGGSAAFPTGSSSIDVDADKLIRHLKFAFMGSVEAQRSRWGAFTDVMYFNVGGSRSETRDLAIAGMQLPPGVTANASLDVKAWVWTLAGNYRAVSSPEMNLDVFGGARLLDVKSNLGWEFRASR